MRKLIAGALLWGDGVWDVVRPCLCTLLWVLACLSVPARPTSSVHHACANHASLPAPQASYPRVISWWRWITHRYSTRPSGEAGLTHSPPAAWLWSTAAACPAHGAAPLCCATRSPAAALCPSPHSPCPAPPSLPSLPPLQALLLH